MKVQQMTSTLAGLLQRHEQEAHTSINLAPSENVLSPLARLPFVLDMYGRYFFDDLPKHGIHKFFGGLQPGEIETQIVVPLLKRMTGATYVTVKPLSGLHCMTIALTALTKPGERVLSISPANGGHDCLSPLGARLGLHMESLPMSSPHDLDLLALEQVLTDDPPALVYIDQSTVLFPVDPRPIRNIVDKHSLPTRIHYDSSHLNGLILGQAVFNPLEQGAHTFGGSTHKTLPGPHKGFLATTDAEIPPKIYEAENVFTSHHQPAASVSLGITLLELLKCGGQNYAKNVVANARHLAKCLADGGLRVAGSHRGFTECHQVWIDPVSDDNGIEITGKLESSGIRVNRFVGLPGIPHAAYRLSSAELTRLGGGRDEIEALADILIGLISGDLSISDARIMVHKIRGRLSRIRYCFNEGDLARMGFDDSLIELVRQIERLGSRIQTEEGYHGPTS